MVPSTSDKVRWGAKIASMSTALSCEDGDMTGAMGMAEGMERGSGSRLRRGDVDVY